MLPRLTLVGLATLLATTALPQAETVRSTRRPVDSGPLTVTGQVVNENGAPAAAGIDVRSCAPTVKTGPDGRFTISADGSSLKVDSKGCAITVSKPGFESTEIKLMVTSGDIDLGELTLRPVKDPETPAPRTTISQASLDAPEPAWKAFEKGRRAAEKRKWKDAEKRLREAVGIYPEFAQAWAILGNVYRDQNKTEAAREAYEAALHADPNHIPPKLGLATLALGESDWSEAEKIATAVIRQSPVEFPNAYLCHATALYNSGEYEAAAGSARRGIEIDGRKQAPKLEHLLGVILARQGHYGEALIHLRSYLNYGAGSDARAIREQIAKIEAQAAR